MEPLEGLTRLVQLEPLEGLTRLGASKLYVARESYVGESYIATVAVVVPLAGLMWLVWAVWLVGLMWLAWLTPLAGVAGLIRLWSRLGVGLVGGRVGVVCL